MTQTKSKGGQRAFQPTDEQRRTVRAMVAYGVPQDEIANVIGINKRTLEKHFRKEIDTATAEANAKVAQALYHNAVNGHVGAQCFWLKTRAGWRENHRVEHAGDGGGPVKTENAVTLDPTKLDDDTLAKLMQAKGGGES